MTRVAVTLAALTLAAAGSTTHAQQPPSPDNYLLAQEVPRFALVVGVQNYEHLDRVPNALNDMTTAAQAFRRAGFTTVFEEPDPTAPRLQTAIKQFTQLLDRTERPAVVAIFFAGHGFQDGDNSFIVPKDASPATLLDDSFPIANVVVTLAPRKVGITFLFIDACRTLTPLSRPASVNGAAIPARPGFGQLASFDGAVMSFAPGFNEAALSSAQQGDVNSPYTAGLGLHLSTVGLSVASALDNVYRYVRIRTGDRQHPMTLTQASTSTIRFVPLSADTDLQAEERHWRKTLEGNRAECVKDFLIAFPDSRFAISALRWLTETPGASSQQGGGASCPQR